MDNDKISSVSWRAFILAMRLQTTNLAYRERQMYWPSTTDAIRKTGNSGSHSDGEQHMSDEDKERD